MSLFDVLLVHMVSQALDPLRTVGRCRHLMNFEPERFQPVNLPATGFDVYEGQKKRLDLITERSLNHFVFLSCAQGHMPNFIIG